MRFFILKEPVKKPNSDCIGEKKILGEEKKAAVARRSLRSAGKWQRGRGTGPSCVKSRLAAMKPPRRQTLTLTQTQLIYFNLKPHTNLTDPFKPEITNQGGDATAPRGRGSAKLAAMR